MGIYKNKVTDFIERSLKLVEQYENLKEDFVFDEQYNHTLLINCLLGIVVLPKEKAVSHISTKRIEIMKMECGIQHTTFHLSIKTIYDLIIELRKAVAHFNIDFHSENDSGLVDWIEFKNDEKDIIIAKFYKHELLLFVNYYGKLLLTQLSHYYINNPED